MNLSETCLPNLSEPVSDSPRQPLDRSDNLSRQGQIAVSIGLDRISAPVALDSKNQATGQCVCGEPIFIKLTGECKTHYFRRKGRERYARVERAEGRHVCPTCGSSARSIDLASAA